MKHLVSTAIVAVIVSLLTVTAVGVIAQEPAPIRPAAVSNVNADKVDGRHAVGAGMAKKKRRNKLVATDNKGLLPSNIVKPFWSKIRDVPAGFADGVDNQGVTKITITRVLGPSTSVGVGDWDSGSVSCPAGSKAIGGGFASDSPIMTVFTSRADATVTGWDVSAKNESGSPAIIQAIVQCMSTTPSGAIATARKGAKVTSVK
jgi:hypothetical protein